MGKTNPRVFGTLIITEEEQIKAPERKVQQTAQLKGMEQDLRKQGVTIKI